MNAITVQRMPDSARRPVRQAPERQVRTNRKTRLRLSAVPPGEPRTSFRPPGRPQERQDRKSPTGYAPPERARPEVPVRGRSNRSGTRRREAAGATPGPERENPSKSDVSTAPDPRAAAFPTRPESIRSPRERPMRTSQTTRRNRTPPPDCGCEIKRGPTGPTTRRAAAREPARPAPRAAHR